MQRVENKVMTNVMRQQQVAVDTPEDTFCKRIRRKARIVQLPHIMSIILATPRTEDQTTSQTMGPQTELPTIS